MKKLLFWVLLGVFVFGLRTWLVKNVGFTAKEHLITYRSWSISNFHSDEFGRVLPIIFNDSEGLQLPVLSYISSPITLLFGSNQISEYVLDFIFFSLIFFAAILLKYGSLFSILLVINPVYFWPGNWEAKLLTVCLLIVWKFVIAKNVRLLSLVLICIFSLFVSFDAWFIVPTVLIVGYFYNIYLHKDRHNSILPVFVGCLMVILISIAINKDITNQIKRNYFDIFKDIGIINTVNSFRGEDQKIGLGLVGKVLHNKTQFIPVLLGQSVSFLSPSFLFAIGDKDAYSNSLWIPPFLNIFFFLLIYSLFCRQGKAGKYLGAWVVIVGLLLGFKMFPLSESKIYLLAIPLILLIVKNIENLPIFFKRFIFVLTVFNLFVLSILSGSVKSVYHERCSIEFVAKIVEVSKLNIGNKVLVSDDICSDLGPGISLIMSQKSEPLNEKKYFIEYIKTIGNVEIVSPQDIVTHNFSSEEIASKKYYVRILSDKLTQYFPEELGKQDISKQGFYKLNENYSVYLINSNEK